MTDTNSYPNYIGVDTTLLQSLNIKIKYTGDSVKDVVVTQGSLVSVAHVVNKNGVLSQNLSLGIVKEIGMDSVARVFNASTNISNPSYIVIDKSTTYKADLVTIYVRDIRNIIVGPMANGDFAKGEMGGETLPDISGANLNLHLGKLFYLTKTDEVNFIEKGIYYCAESGWMLITTANNKSTSPLSHYWKSWMDGNGERWTLANNVLVTGDSVDDGFTPVPALTVEVEEGAFTKMSRVASNINYQISVVLKTELATTNDPEYLYLPSVIGNVSTDVTPLQASPINTSRVKVEDKFYDIYHRITKDGEILIHYPNIAGIKELNLYGSYLI